MARDCNRNGVPDNCDVDCLQPGCTAYPCGRSDDSSPQNGIPDECEGAPASRTYTSTADFATLGTLINLDEVNGVLSRSQMPEPLPNLWIAASNRGTIVRINTDASTGVPVGAILGEYHTGPEGHGENPSRTAVNLDGEVWVANRHEGTGAPNGSVTRIGILEGGTLIDPAACEPDGRATYAPPFAYNTCVDRNGDGMITTSNGLGPLPWPFEGQPLEPGTVDTAEDECIINYVTLTGEASNHVSIDKNNNLWVGGHQNIFDQVDGQTGEIIEGDANYPGTFSVGTGGHGGLIDSDNVLWSASTSGNTGLFRYDTDLDINNLACCQPEILADFNNDLVIDEEDRGLGGTSGFITYINDDNDDGDASIDMDQSPVSGENDLSEIQLFAACGTLDPNATWSLTWTYDTIPPPDPDPIRIWLHSDKSDGSIAPGEPGYPGQAGAPIVNGAPNPWPPPSTVWLEAIGSFEDVHLTFAIKPIASQPAQAAQPVNPVSSSRYTIKLRAVMVVEPNPDPDFVPTYSGGCMLSRTEVKDVMQQLVDFGDKIAPGINFDWDCSADNAVIRLQSECMKLEPIPFPVDVSVCPTNFPAGNPRLATPNYFSNYVVGKDEMTQAHLLCPDPSPPPGEACYDEDDADCGYVPNVFCDGYKYNQCVINIYFVGGIANASGVQGAGYSNFFLGPWPPPPPSARPFILIGDGAFGSALNPTRVDITMARRTLEHEVGCHYLPQNQPHSSTPPPGTCPNDLCIDGSIRQTCLGLDYSLPVPNPLPATMENVPSKLQADTANKNSQPCQQGP